MDNDHSNNQDKMLLIGVPLKTELLNLTKKQKAVPRVELMPDHPGRVGQYLLRRTR